MTQLTINVQLGMRVRYLRKLHSWSQEELAFQSNINKNYISDLERGTRNPSLVVLERIATSLGITLSELFQGLKVYEDL